MGIIELIFISLGRLHCLIIEAPNDLHSPRFLINPFPDAAVAWIVPPAPTFDAPLALHALHNEDQVPEAGSLFCIIGVSFSQFS